MPGKKIYITDGDMQKLREQITVDRELKKEKEKHFQELEAELGRGEIVHSQDIPVNVITMNSKVQLKDLNTGEEITYHLVFPEDADIGQGRISVLAPIGTALLGYSVGDIVEWEVPAGTAKLLIEKILYQPEWDRKDFS